MGMGGQSRITALAIGFALTFQIYGSAISFETLAEDLYSPMHDRIFSSPVEIRSIILSILVSSTVVSFLQTSILLVFSSIILGAIIPLSPSWFCWFYWSLWSSTNSLERYCCYLPVGSRLRIWLPPSMARLCP